MFLNICNIYLKWEVQGYFSAKIADEIEKTTVDVKNDTFQQQAAIMTASIHKQEVYNERHTNSRFDEKVQFPGGR